MDKQFEGYEPWLLRAFQMSEEHPVRKGIEKILGEIAKVESIGVSAPGLSDSERQYQAGRLGAIQDLYFSFEQLFKDANKEKDTPIDKNWDSVQIRTWLSCPRKLKAPSKPQLVASNRRLRT